VLGLLVGCTNLKPPEAPQQTPEERLQLAWRGHPVIDVEHPVFSAMETRVQELSDGSVIMHHLRWRELAERRRRELVRRPELVGDDGPARRRRDVLLRPTVRRA